MIRNFFSSKNQRKIIPVALAVAILLLAVSIHLVHAAPPSLAPVNAGTSFSLFGLGDIAYSVISEIAFGISYLIAWIAGVFIGIAAWLVGAILYLNTGIFQSAIVQQGFGATLAVANLGFILGIIVIAIATILRNQTYGIKQILWKLVVMAILVNFGLVIMAPIVGFANSMTQYFLNCIDPGAGCNASASNGLSTMNGFATKLAGAFNPQVGFLTANSSTLSSASAPNLSWQGAFSVSAADFGKMLVPLFSILFVAVESIIIIIVLLALVFMLLVRYLYIAILAILLPFAWLSWVFPSFKQHWSRWWNEFIRWTFFAPIVVFFLYLAIQTMGAMSQAGGTPSQMFDTYKSNSNVIWGSLASFFTSIFLPVIGNILNMIVMCGLSVAGLIVADKMSINGAGAAVKAVETVGNGVGNYARKQSAKFGRAAYRGAGGERLTRAMQQGRIGTTLKKIPVLGKPLGGLVRRGESAVGRGLAAISTNRAMVDEEVQKVPNTKEEFLNNMEGSMNDQERMAYFRRGTEKNWIKPGMQVDGQEVSDYLKKNKSTFHSYGEDGEGSTEEKARDKSGLTFSEGSLEAKQAASRNAELDKKRQADIGKLQEKAGLSDEDMEFYTGTKAEEVEKLPEADKNRYEELKKKVKKVESQGGLSDDEQKEYNENKEKVTKFDGKIKKLVATDPELVAGQFFDDEQARAQLEKEGKKVPGTLEKESLDRVRATILQTFAEGFSPQNARGFIDAIAKANNMQYFESTVGDIKQKDPAQFQLIKSLLTTNKDLKRWMQSNSGKALFGNLRELFELPKLGKKGKDGRVIEDSEEEEEETRTT